MRQQPLSVTCEVACRAAIRAFPLLSPRDGVTKEQLLYLLGSVLTSAVTAYAIEDVKEPVNGNRAIKRLADDAATQIASNTDRKEVQFTETSISGLEIKTSTTAQITNYRWQASSYSADAATACSELKPNANARACKALLSAWSSFSPNSAVGAGMMVRVESEMNSDAEGLQTTLNKPLWTGSLPKLAIKPHHELLSYLNEISGFKFWKRFYEGMWNGTFDEWDLALEVIQIDEVIWEEGVEAVAAEIEKIEARLKSNVATNEANQPERDIAKYRPDNVVHLFQNAPQVRASFELSAETLNERLDLFHQMACWNEPIPLFVPLREMPAALTRAAEILAAGNQSEKTEEALKDEVAKLRALLATVEAELKAAKAEIDELRKKPWWKSAKAVAGGSVIGAIVGTTWMISGDEIGPDKRWDMLTEYWEFVFSREDFQPEPLNYQLPKTWDA